LQRSLAWHVPLSGRMRWVRKGGWLAAAVAVSAAAGCAAPDPAAGCEGEKCDSGGSAWKAQLDGRKDPIASWLRASTVDGDGMMTTNYGEIVEQIAQQSGCGVPSIRTFIVSDSLVEDSAFPRLVSTVCSDDVVRAADFFIAASFREEGTHDVDAHRIEMFAWDPETLKYNFYAADPDEGETQKGRVKVEIEPGRCRDCHLAPRNLSSDRMPMTPIMNELTRPWVHWNAEPDAENFQYEIPAETKVAPHFRAYGENRQASAARLEKIVVAGHAKVASARIRERRASPPSLEASMALLRPLFCEEQVNYATEDFESGVISASAVVPGGLKEAFIGAGASGWPWNWLTDGNLRMPAGAAAEKLVMMPVRGNVDIETEKALVAAGTLTPHQVLRVRALDWKTPVLSTFRCDLWKSAAARFRSEPPRLEPTWRNSDAMKVLFEEIMKLDGTPLKPAAEDRVIALDVADPARVAALKAALKSASVPETCGGGFCSLTLMGLGSTIDGYVKSVEAAGRAPLLAARRPRLCEVVEQFENKPALPAGTCP
jgi:hypothetical protein